MAKKPAPFPKRMDPTFTTASTQPLKPREPGVYLDWHEDGPDGYHADEAFSNSKLRRLIVGPAHFWTETDWNPDREPEAEDTDAKTVGDAYHKRINQGPEEFARVYAVAPDPADYPGALMKGDDFKAAIRVINERDGKKLKLSGSNAELCASLREAGYEGVLWPEVEAAWDVANQGKVKLKAALVRRLELAAAVLHALPDVGPIWTRGHAEVSICWINRQGVAMRTRLDRWWPGEVLEFKTIANQTRQPFDISCIRTITNDYYHVQCVIHREGCEAALMMPDDMWHGFTPEQIAELKAGGVPDVRLLFVGKSAPDVFQRIFGPEVPLDYARYPDGRAVVGQVPREPSNLWKSAENIYAQMAARFKLHWTTFGRSPWYNAKPAIGLRDGEPGMSSFALSKDTELED